MAEIFKIANNKMLVNKSKKRPITINSIDNLPATDDGETYLIGANWYYWNGIGWADGGVYIEIDDGELRNDINEIYSNLICGKNIFNKSDRLNGYINPTNGVLEQASDNFSTNYIEIDNTKKYAYSNFQLGAYYDANKTFISGTNDAVTNWNGATLPSNAKYIRVSANVSKLDIAQIEIGSTPTQYESYRLYPKYEQNKEIKYTTLVAQPSVSTITELNNSIVDSDYYNRYIILLKKGTYFEKDIYLKPYVTLKGIDENQCIIYGQLPQTATDSEINPCSTINLIYSNYLENLTITCKNMRYPIHDDGGGTDKERVVKNCTFIHYGNNEVRNYRQEQGLDYSNVWASENAYGSGVNSGDNMLFENCTFIGTVNAWGTHNNVNYEKATHITHRNNKFIVTENGNYSMGIASMGSTNTESIVFEGCTANAPIKYFTMGTDINNLTKKSEFNLTGFGNNIPFSNQVSTDDYYTPLFNDETKKVIANETITRGTCCCYDSDMQHIRKMTSNDDISIFAGIAIENISGGTMGFIQFKGYIDGRYLSIANGSFGLKYGVGSNGALELNVSNLILVGVGYNIFKFIK